MYSLVLILYLNLNTSLQRHFSTADILNENYIKLHTKNIKFTAYLKKM